ncbi:MAG: T9SS type A sorting domain-containing protein [Bacteroidales bacterium]|nr:T9SS type A sorting domain-containing protein [Bacteroidales bacterium]MBO7142009.1 T9SS type A sorting domain-containing protein [Bacteroidales bacterium]
MSKLNMKLITTILTTVLLLMAFSQAEAQKTIIPNFFVQNQNLTNHEVVIYPNPVVGKVVNFKSASLIRKVEITNIIGKCVKTKENDDYIFDDLSILLENCESGIYLAKITFDDDKVLIKKLIVK